MSEWIILFLQQNIIFHSIFFGVFDARKIQIDKNFSDDETQPTNINESFDVALEELWPLVIKNGLDKTILPDITEGFSYVC